MIEPMNPNEGAERPNLGREAARSDTGASASGAPLSDREVPLPGAEAFGTTPAAVHAWLDGEGSEADARLAAAGQVAMWTRIAGETTARRRMTTPADLQARIMDALPEARPAMATSAAAAVAGTATRARIALSPMMATLAAVSLIAVGYLIAKLGG